MKFHVDVDFDARELVMPASRAETILAVQVEKDTRPFVPALTMSLNNRTRVQGNEIIYPGPYARHLYNGKVMVDSKTGKGPMNIPGVGLRFHKGTTLTPTSRDLVFTKTVHPNATSHWLDASKAQNMQKWESILAKAVTYG